MRARRAEFVVSASDARAFPRPDVPEFAFAGRSNVGKSSLMNALVSVPGLARTSRTPGRTRLVNWFRVEPPRGPPVALVDLPGYGYAKVSRELRRSWQPLVEAYLQRGDVVRMVFVLIDARRSPGQEDQELIAYLDRAELGHQLVVTKSDKLPKAKRKLAAAAIRRELGMPREPIVCSATTGDGLDDLWRVIVGPLRP